ncbi:hypothetical protein AB0D49_39595 [Streptomyces sp. NPDC048290]|uniref:hypothetical protein n=1 Tax=Streptomyces sp. NPDC048290 TaxID=3155811 RepID=UPI0034299613
MQGFDTALPASDDEGEAWLAHAGALDAAGDPRGAAIRLEHSDADAAGLTAAYGEVERYVGLDALRDDGSWRFTWRRGFIEEASFALAEETRPRRRALAERLLADLPHAGALDPADPEQWEAALIDALLSHPAAHRLGKLELRLTDYHRSAEHAALALSRRTWPRLETLYFGHAFGTLFEHHETSTGGRIEPETYLHAPVVPKADDDDPDVV